jgi:hypothetical protein
MKVFHKLHNDIAALPTFTSEHDQRKSSLNDLRFWVLLASCEQTSATEPAKQNPTAGGFTMATVERGEL